MDYLAWAAQSCSRKEYCRSEIHKKLLAKGANAEQAEAVMQRLVDDGFIDESRYARCYTSDKFRFDHWGKLKIANGLRAKGIGTADIDAALQTIPDEDYLSALTDFIQSKQRTTRAKNAFQLRRKVARSAIARGFEPHFVFDLTGELDTSPEL